MFAQEEREEIVRQTFTVRQGQIQFEVLDKNGRAIGMELWISIASYVVYLVNPSSVEASFREIAYHRGRKVTYLRNIFLHRVVDWFDKISDELTNNFGEEQNREEWAAKMAVAVLTLFDVLGMVQQSLERMTRKDENKLLEGYMSGLSRLEKIMSVWEIIQPSIAMITGLSGRVSDLIAFVSPRSYQWASFLGYFCHADPSYAFLRSWRASIFNDKSEAVKQFEKTCDQVLKFAGLSCDEIYCRLASRAAVLAAPTLGAMVKTMCIFNTVYSMESLYCEFENDITCRLYDHFQRESVENITAVLLKEMKSEHGNMQKALRLLVTSFLRSQCLPFGADKKINLVSKDLPSLMDILKCEYILHRPLLDAENRFISDLSASYNQRTGELLGQVILKVFSQVETPDAPNKEVVISDVERGWLQNACEQAVASNSQASSSPYSVFAAVNNCLMVLLKSSSVLEDVIVEAADTLVRRNGFVIKNLLQDAVKMSRRDMNLKMQIKYVSCAVDSIHEYWAAHAVEDVQDGDRAMLEWISTPALAFEGRLQEELCLCLLDHMGKTFCTVLFIRPEETLVGSSFLTLLLQIEGASAKVQKHLLYQESIRALDYLLKQINSGNTSIEVVERIIQDVEGTWQRMCKVQQQDYKTIENACLTLRNDLTRLEGFTLILQHAIVLKHDGIETGDIEDCKSWLSERTARRKYFSLREVEDPNHWPVKLSLQFFESILMLKESQILRNIFRIQANLMDRQNVEADEKRDGSPWTGLGWTCVAELLVKSLESYAQEWQDFLQPSYPMAKVCVFFHDLTPTKFDMEVKLFKQYLVSIQAATCELPFTTRRKCIQYWVAVKAKEPMINSLRKVYSMFSIQIDNNGNIADRLETLCSVSKSSTLEDFSTLFRRNAGVVSYFSEDEDHVVNELAHSEIIVTFLKEKAGDDLRVLIDAVEEQKEELIDEALVSDFIHLHKVFSPIFQRSSISLKDLKETISKELSGGSAAAVRLAAKLNCCEANVCRLQHFVASVADRCYVLRDSMDRILTSGVYTFLIEQMCDDFETAFCSLQLSCGGLGEVSAEAASKTDLQNHFSLSDLKDLRSRARMVLSNKSQQSSLTESDDISTFQRHYDTTHTLLMFINHVDLSEQLVDQISMLHKIGHLGFEVYSTRCNGLAALQQKVNEMNIEITCWTTSLQDARLAHHSLNYFTGLELRLIFRCLMKRTNQNETHICCDLLQWAQPGLDTATVLEALQNCAFAIPNDAARVASEEESPNYPLLTCLKSIAQAIDHIFTLKNVQTDDNTKLSAAAESRSDNPFMLVSVENQQHELNVLVEILYKHETCLRSSVNTIFICSSSTAWEEVHLFLQRLFAKTSQESNLFTIVFLEKLSFDCQSQFMTALEELHRTSIQYLHQVKRTLALICWTKSQALQAFSHHLGARIQYMSGYSNEEIHHYLPVECKRMVVVTSEIPGLGKTESIQHQASGSLYTLYIGGDSSRHSLILQLKRMKITCNDALHIDITTEKGYEILNGLLFELLILGGLKSSTVGVFKLEATQVFVEIANTLGNHLLNSVPICSWLSRQHSVWDLSMLRISENPDSDEQVVCAYLHLMDVNQLYNCSAEQMMALPAAHCKQLLTRYFINNENPMSYTILNLFLKVFANQLRQVRTSPFFSAENLDFMGADRKFLPTLVASLLQVSKEISLRSVKPWLQKEQEQMRDQNIEDTMHSRMSSLLRWSDTNHIMIFFHEDGPMTVLYRDKNLIPNSIRELICSQSFQSQGSALQDYSAMSSKDLWDNLWPVLRTHKIGPVSNYVLTPDNFLKMAFISLRVNAGVPVIIMGEAGCGKTSLLKALAGSCDVKFFHLPMHAGTTEQNLKSFIHIAESQAETSNQKVWAFLDEINTSQHLGLLNGLLCHKLIDGRLLHPNLTVLAACNPYRVKDVADEVGLSLSKPGNVNGTSRKQKLAYIVHPLPEAMLDFVWDYGILSDNDERAYITAMLGPRSSDIVDLLASSQQFIRIHLGTASVSLRDVQRWICLYDWFLEDLKRRNLLKKHCRSDNVEGTAKIMACSLCYHSRFSNKNLRKLYRKMCCMFLNFGTELLAENSQGLNRISAKRYLQILDKEQRDILNRMELPPGIAKNKALVENVFVTFVCLLNHIPVFVVGKPGSGKTLALQTIYSNLRGTESKDEYLKILPRMLLVSYQGSQNSTSEGIVKVFEKANRYVESNRQHNVLVVVVLDEVGLAETSRHNPLKVLHPLLEPEVPQLSVIGISNWSLDAAKMNRAVHLSQPDPELEDLYATSLAIFESYQNTSSIPLTKKLRDLASAYHKYIAFQSRPNFHGLRDFYSLVKSLRGCSKITIWEEELPVSIWRNFGGSADDTKCFLSILEEETSHKILDKESPPVMDLIKANLVDTEARHLLLITKGDSAVGILEHALHKNEDFAVIHGSNYKDDKSEDYSYLMLSEIILHMEVGRCILLKNAEQIWSSLYDMLNQHYTVIGGRRNCRIALGAYSNPMCYVHDKFRCIVVVDFHQIPSTDPPFLNRFEKQVLTYESILNEAQRKAMQSIRLWAHTLAAEGSADSRSASDLEGQMFAGYYEDTVPSLVILHFKQITNQSPSSLKHAALERCKIQLLRTAHVDSVARAHLLKTSKMKECTEQFFSWKDRECLQNCLQEQVSNKDTWADVHGFKLLIVTCTTIQLSLERLLVDLANFQLKVQLIRLGDCSSERQLQTRIQCFWKDKCANLLLLQADDDLDRDHISLAMFLINKARATFVAENPKCTKHATIIIHKIRDHQQQSHFSFLCGWQLVTLDQLQREPFDIRVFLDCTLTQALEFEAVHIENIMTTVLTWSFLCIKYDHQSHPAEYAKKMVNRICKDEALSSCIKQRALMWISSQQKNFWQTEVLNNRKLLSTSMTIQGAFLRYLEEQLREPVARLVYLLEKTSSLACYFSCDLDTQLVWREMFVNLNLIDCNSAPTPCFPEGYKISVPAQLSLPFSFVYANHVDTHFKELFLSNNQYHSICKDVDASMTPEMAILAQYIHSNLDDYVSDFAKICGGYSGAKTNTNPLAFEWILRANMGANISHASDLHVHMWRKGKCLQAQASLASASLSSNEIRQELNMVKKAGYMVKKSEFTERLTKRCFKRLLPTQKVLKRLGGMEAWLHEFHVLLQLIAPIDTPEFVFVLQTIQKFACLVVLPLKLDSTSLEMLGNFVMKQPEVSPHQILKGVVEIIPELDKLAANEQNCWFQFFASVFEQYSKVAIPRGEELEQVGALLLRIQKPICLMGHAMIVLFQMCLSVTPKPSCSLKCPEVITVLCCQIPSCLEDISKDIPKPHLSVISRVFSDPMRGPSLDYNHPGVILLSDRLYELLCQTVTPELLNGKDTEHWDNKLFKHCLVSAFSVLRDEAQPSLQAILAIALLKSFLYVAAQVLVQVYDRNNHPKTKNFLHSAQVCLTKVLQMNPGETLSKETDKIIVPQSLSDMLQEGSAIKCVLQIFLMKIFSGHLGKSTSDVVSIAEFCKQNQLQLSCLLDHSCLSSEKSRIAFDPFMSTSEEFMKATVALRKLIAGEERMWHSLIENADESQQAAILSAVASNLCTACADRQLDDNEMAVMRLLRDKQSAFTRWEPLQKQILRCLATDHQDSIFSLSKELPTADLQFRCIAIDVLLTVANLACNSPLRGYLTLNSKHLHAFVLAAPNNHLKGVSGLGQFAEYKCQCGFPYIITECTRPNSIGTCPRCSGKIGGASHNLVSGNTRSSTSTVMPGYMLNGVGRSNDLHGERIQAKCYRFLHLLVHYCLLIGVHLNHESTQLALCLSVPNDKARICVELTHLIKEDFQVLDRLLGCQHEATCVLVHCILKSLSMMPADGALQTSSQRDAWEKKFADFVQCQQMDEVITKYLQAHNRNNLMNDVIMERHSCLTEPIEIHFRLTTRPSLENYRPLFMQDTRRMETHPFIACTLAHVEELQSLSNVQPIVEFCKALQKTLGHKITRHVAVVTAVGVFLTKRRDLVHLYERFEKCWNSLRLQVRGYECHEFKEPVPKMDRDQPIAMCLLEERDQGIYLAAMLELLRTRQNRFLEDIQAVIYQTGCERSASRSLNEIISQEDVPIQSSQDEHIIDFKESWAEDLIFKAGMSELTFGRGTRVQYDDDQIEMEMVEKLILGKPRLKAGYVEFPYEHETFHRHATLLSDVAERVHQEKLSPETLRNIEREVRGEGSLLGKLDLCLGFLRQTGGDPDELLGDYCKRWVTDEAEQQIMSKPVFDHVYLKHAVSLYEGLEDAASTEVGELVAPMYRAALGKLEMDDLQKWVTVKRNWKGGASEQGAMGAEEFKQVLKQFLFRYLTGINSFKEDEMLGLYLTDPRLVSWPVDDVDLDTLQNTFPASFLLKHSHSLYLLLDEMCKGTDWVSIGYSRGCIVP